MAKKDVTPTTRLDLLRAMGASLPELRPESSAAIADMLRSSPDMPTRWLIAQPLAHLARSHDATTGELTRLAEMARRDPEWPVRARAVELAAGIAPLTPTLVAAVPIPSPASARPRSRRSPSPSSLRGTDAAARALANDPGRSSG